ncbi:MAG: hypothetical protein HOP28_18475 [Gemmatimonadales bacterium]|nr:hypothetical protein [Gemmatimonadales bacterium]
MLKAALLFVFAALFLSPLPPPVAGTVFDDRNANGVRDPGEPGLAGVVVSNQVEVVRTGADGGFELPSVGTGVIFVSVPEGRRVVGRFWRATDGGPPVFALAPLAAPAEFAFIHASDTHLNEQSLPRTRRLKALVDSLKPAFLIITGDLIRDALRVPEAASRPQFELAAREFEAIGVPVWTVPGNHDLFGIERHLSLVPLTHPLYGRGMYRHYLGPDYYSFNYGGVHFVGVNSVDHEDLWYWGHVDSLQLAWLKRDIATLPPGTPVVTFNHIPFATTAIDLDGYTDDPPAPTLIRVRGTTKFRHMVNNTDTILAALKPARLELALGGHTHRRESIAYPADGRLIRFHQASAVIAGAEIAGVPTQSGVTVYRVRGGRVDDGTFVPLP